MQAGSSSVGRYPTFSLAFGPRSCTRGFVTEPADRRWPSLGPITVQCYCCSTLGPWSKVVLRCDPVRAIRPPGCPGPVPASCPHRTTTAPECVIWPPRTLPPSRDVGTTDQGEYIWTRFCLPVCGTLPTLNCSADTMPS